MSKVPLYFYNCPTISLWMQNTLSVAIITSALLAATLFTGQTAKAQATSLGVSPKQVGKTVTSNMTQATSNLEKELVCGTAAVLNGPPGLLVGSVCNSLVAKSVGTSQPSSMSSPSKGTQVSSPKKSVGTSQPSTTNSLPQQQNQQPLCPDGLPPEANGNCPTPPSNNNQNLEQKLTQECPFGEIIPAEATCPSAGSQENNNPQAPSGNEGTSNEGSNNNGGSSNSGGGEQP